MTLLIVLNIAAFIGSTEPLPLEKKQIIMEIFALPVWIVASGFAEELQKKKPEKILANLGQPASSQPTEILSEIDVSLKAQKRTIALHVETSADLMKLCIDQAKHKFGTAFESEEIIRDLAMHLYNEAQQKFHL